MTTRPAALLMLTLGLCGIASGMARAEVACAQNHAGSAMKRPEVGTLFLGPPAQQASQAPDRSSGKGESFVNSFAVTDSQRYVLVCHYRNGDVEHPLPPGLRACTQTASAFVCR